jgi:hypothetical protein
MLLRNNPMQQEFAKNKYYTFPAELGYECNAKKTHTLYAQLQKIGRDKPCCFYHVLCNFNLASHLIV